MLFVLLTFAPAVLAERTLAVASSTSVGGGSSRAEKAPIVIVENGGVYANTNVQAVAAVRGPEPGSSASGTSTETSSIPAGTRIMEWRSETPNSFRAFGDTQSRLMGFDDYIEVVTNAAMEMGLTDFSIAFWLNATPSSEPLNIDGRLVSKGSSQCRTGYMMRLDGDTILLDNAHQGWCLPLFSNQPVADGSWHFVVGVLDRQNSAFRIFVDGTLASQGWHPSDLDLSNGGNLFFGKNELWPGHELYRGLIDEIRLYSRALSDLEIEALYRGEPFAAFTARASLETRPMDRDDSFNIAGAFSLAESSDGIDPYSEIVGITLGASSLTIPPGSFKQEGQGVFTFCGTIDGVDLSVIVAPQPAGRLQPSESGAMTYGFLVEARHAALDGTVLPLNVALSIGDDRGQASLGVGEGRFGTGDDGVGWLPEF